MNRYLRIRLKAASSQQVPSNTADKTAKRKSSKEVTKRKKKKTSNGRGASRNSSIQIQTH
jgi:hypothetical protein